MKSERSPGLPGGVETSLTGKLESARSPGLPGGVETSHFSEFAWCLLEMALATMALSREGRVERSLERQAPSVCLPEMRLACSMWR